MDKIRVLIVDDSAIIRRLLTDALAADPMIEVVGIAANGKIALAKIAQLKPDLVTLDIEMPEMDGLETLSEIRKVNKSLPVIMFSTLTERGATATLDALTRGANAYVTTPSNTGSTGATIKRVQDDLIPKIKVFCKRTCPQTLGETTTTFPGTRPPLVRTTSDAIYRSLLKPASASPPARVDAIAIGTSTGGPNALSKVLADLPSDLPVPVLIVQHMPPVFTARLAERLNQLSPLTVHEAVDGMKVEAGHAYLAPGDFHLTVARNATEVVVKLNQQAPECSCRPAVDVLFRSAANLYGSNLVAAVLTGMGQDGQCGCELIRQAGGWVIAQDQASSVVWGMPGAVSRAGLANEILPLDAVGRSLEQHARRGLRNSRLQLAGV